MQIGLTSYSLGNSLPVLPKQVAAILRKYGSDAHLYMPGPGVPVLGPELVVNGDGSTTTGWMTNNATLASSGGEFLLTSSGLVYGQAGQQVSTNVGSVYQVTYSGRRGTDNGGWMLIGTGALGNSAYATVSLSAANAPYSQLVTATTTNMWVTMQTNNTISGATDYFDNISVKEILGYSNKVSGFTAGNYLESTGQTHAVVDGAVGLVLDAAGSVGANLITGVIGQGATLSGGALIEDTLNSKHGVLLTANVPANRTEFSVIAKAGAKGWLWIYFANYQAGSVWVNLTTGAVGNVDYGVIASSTPIGNGEYLIRVTKLNNTLSYHMGIYAASSNGDTAAYQGTGASAVYLRDMKLCELKGIHATQATTANKPTVRRGIVNLLTYSNDLSNAAWYSKANVTFLGGQVDPLGGASAQKIVESSDGAAAFHSVGRAGATVGSTQTFAALIAPSGRSQVAMQLGVNLAFFDVSTGSVVSYSGGVGVVTLVPAGNGYYLCAYSRDVVTNGNTLIFPASAGSANYQGNGTSGILFAGAAIFAGTYTAQQILDAGGIPLTTTAPASSARGAYAWQFDGSNDSLTLPGPLFQMADDHVVVAAVKPNSISSNIAVFYESGGVGTPIVAGINISAGQPRVYWRDDSSALINLSGTTITTGDGVILSARNTSGTKVFRQNGVQKGSSQSVMGTTTLTSAAIGFDGISAQYFNGPIYAVLAIKGTVSDADLKTLEKWIGSLAGVPVP